MHNNDRVTSSNVQALAAGGESLTVEFKRSRDLNDDAIVEAVVCLANGEGGTLLLGVEDSGEISGMSPRHGEQTHTHKLQAMILNRTEPPVATGVEVVVVDGHDVGVVVVPQAPSPVGTKGGKYLRRTLRADGTPECVPYLLHEMLSASLSAQGRDYAATPAKGAGLTDLDPAEFDRFRRLCGTGKGDPTLAGASDLDLLKALRLTLPEHDNALTLGAVLLFGTTTAIARFVPTAEVVFHELRHNSISTSESLQQPLLRSAERLYELIEVRNTEQELMVGLHRVGIPRIPAGTVRESIANALVHRDYAELGPVQVQLSETGFRVSSPGGFPPGITLDNLLNDSRPRSPILAEALKRAGVVDRAGRGVSQMYEQLLRAGRGEPDYTTSNPKAVIVVVPADSADIEMVRFIVEFETTTQQVLALAQLRILHDLKANGPQTTGELSAGLREPPATTRTNLTRLTELGFVEARGAGRGRRYHLTAAFYRLADASAYLRLQDTDPIQQEHMVLAYVEQFGKITRGKAAELCRLSPDQARVLLRRLVDAQQLTLRGERRGAHYVLTGQ
jgi:ATP-dependent DNA helicase RecG